MSCPEDDFWCGGGGGGEVALTNITSSSSLPLLSDFIFFQPSVSSSLSNEKVRSNCFRLVCTVVVVCAVSFVGVVGIVVIDDEEGDVDGQLVWLFEARWRSNRASAAAAAASFGEMWLLIPGKDSEGCFLPSCPSFPNNDLP